VVPPGAVYVGRISWIRAEGRAADEMASGDRSRAPLEAKPLAPRCRCRMQEKLARFDAERPAAAVQVRRAALMAVW
jgi:hypothetical protein